MTRYDLMDFDPFRNYTIGFDRIFDSLLEVSKLNTSNFPPYNIRKLKDGKYQVELALAGFTKKDIQVELKEGTLSISAKREEKDSDNLTGTNGKWIYNRKENTLTFKVQY